MLPWASFHRASWGPKILIRRSSCAWKFPSHSEQTWCRCCWMTGWQFNRKQFVLSFSLKNHLSFGLRFPPLIISSKMGSLDISHNQNWISSRFSSQNSSQNVCYCIASLGIYTKGARCDAVHAELAKLDPRVKFVSALGIGIETVDESDRDIIDQTHHPFNFPRGKNWCESWSDILPFFSCEENSVEGFGFW